MNTATYNQIRTYIDQHPLATLSTINSDGSPHGAIVYVCADDRQPIVYFITKQQTRKYQNLQEREQVSLTIASPSENSTLQASGHAFEARGASIIDEVVEKITRSHASAEEWLPPIAKLRAGAYEVVGINLAYARLAQFHGMSIGDERIFTELYKDQ